MEIPVTDRREDRALEVIALAFSSIAHSLAIIAANSNPHPPAIDALKQVTKDLKVSHDKLVDAINRVNVPPATPAST